MGKILAKAQGSKSQLWVAIFPGIAIFLTVTLFNLIGEGLTDAGSSTKEIIELKEMKLLDNYFSPITQQVLAYRKQPTGLHLSISIL